MSEIFQNKIYCEKSVSSLSNNGLASGRVGRHKHGLIVLNTQQCLFLKRIKDKWIFLRRLCSSDNQRNVLHAWWNGHFVRTSFDRLKAVNLNPWHHFSQTTKLTPSYNCHHL